MGKGGEREKRKENYTSDKVPLRVTRQSFAGPRKIEDCF